MLSARLSCGVDGAQVLGVGMAERQLCVQVLALVLTISRLKFSRPVSL